MKNAKFKFLSSVMFPAALITSIVPALAPAQENPIDCEILICMAAGFPAASGCTPALTEMLDRVKPWPIEPPLQIWNCPMNIPREYGNYEIDLASPEYAFATSFNVYNVDIDADRDEGDCTRIMNIEHGTYDETGDFSWTDISRFAVPAAVGVELTGCNQKLRTVFIEWDDEEGTYSSQQISY